jgi:hypothetical protein
VPWYVVDGRVFLCLYVQTAIVFYSKMVNLKTKAKVIFVYSIVYVRVAALVIPGCENYELFLVGKNKKFTAEIIMFRLFIELLIFSI